jgi:hypothetical protein
MISALDVLVMALAANQAVEVWHHGAIFAGRRAAVESWPVLDDEGLARLGRLGRWNYRFWEFWQSLLLCPHCLSVWVGVAVAAGWLGGPWWLQAAVVGLATSRLANLLSDAGKRVGLGRTKETDRDPPE